MSSKLHGLVWEGCAATGMILSRIAVMARLADYSNDEGISWPAVKTIAAQIGAKSENTVRSAIKQLASDGWLKVIERKVGGRNQSNVYRLNIEKLEQAAMDARAAIRNPSKIDTSNFDPSTVEASNSEPSKIEASNNEGLTPQNLKGDPSTVEADPSIELKTDPKDKNTSCPNAALSDEASDEDFLSRHPEAVVFSAKKRKWGSQEDLRCAEWIFSRIIRLYEQAAEADGTVARPDEPNWISWANEIRLMVTLDNRTHRQICELFGRANRDRFWCKNILSPSKLREKWDELTLKLSNIGASPAGGEVIGGHWNSPEGWETVL